MATKKTNLWQIEGFLNPFPSYIFGSMHVQDIRAFSHISLIFEKMDACQSFAAESHLDHLQASSGQANLPAGITLRSLMPPKRYVKLRKLLLKIGLPDLDHFQNTPPLLITGLIGGLMLGKDMPISLDEHLWRHAQQNGKTLYGIETAEEQMQVLGKIPLEAQVHSLLGLGRNISQYRKHLQMAAARYQQCELQRMSVSSAKQSGKLRKILIYDRNQLMAERIADLLAQESVFVAIGAGHLLGGKGVLRLLKQRGLSVRPIALISEMKA